MLSTEPPWAYAAEPEEIAVRRSSPRLYPTKDDGVVPLGDALGSPIEDCRGGAADVLKVEKKEVFCKP